jgi:3-hydroxyacyl-[acyl-carrier-protein] dehydratase
MSNLVDNEMKKKVLDLVPQQPPFRFIDEIIELSDEHVVGSYTFKKDEFFYKGHFPGNPVTPGVILVETMAQIGLVPMGIYLELIDNKEKPVTIFFSDCEADFMKVVKPGDRVIVRSKKEFYRRRKLKAKAQLELENGEIAVQGCLSGIGVEK